MDQSAENGRGRLPVRRAAGVVALAGAVAFAGLAVARMADENTSEPEVRTAAWSQAADAVGGLSGMIVVRDPESGELRAPSPGEANDLLAATSALFDQSNEGLYSEPLPNGGLKMNLQGRFHNATVAVAGADGRLGVVCAEHPDQVAGAAHQALHARDLDAYGAETR